MIRCQTNRLGHLEPLYYISAMGQVKYKNKIYYNEIYGQRIISIWKNIFTMPYLMPFDHHVTDLQYKILFGIIANKNKIVYQIGIEYSNVSYMPDVSSQSGTSVV